MRVSTIVYIRKSAHLMVFKNNCAINFKVTIIYAFFKEKTSHPLSTINLKRLKDWLHQPYPYNYNIPKLIRKNLKIGAFISLFLFVFKPFGISGYDIHEQIERCIGFGLITLFINTVFEITVLSFRQRILQSEDWATKNAILKIIFSIILISSGNALIKGSLPALNFLNSQQLEFLKGNEQKIEALNQQLKRISSEKFKDPLIQFPNENGELELQLDAGKIIYFKSESNYLEIHVDHKERPERFLLRNRIKIIEELLPANFIRCHRSYIVNRDKIKKVEGSKRGYQLLFDGRTDRVPVSRSRIERFNALIERQVTNL